MDDPPALRDPGDTGDPIGDRRRTGDGGGDTVDDDEWQDPATRPNRHDANDVSVPVMTVSVLSDFGVERDPDANVAVATGRGECQTSTTCSEPTTTGSCAP